VNLPGSALQASDPTPNGDVPVAPSVAAIYGFVAGFSEPFVLGILSRITGVADAAANDAVGPSDKTTPADQMPAGPESPRQTAPVYNPGSPTGRARI
jgi:hypothetical protein